MCCTGSVPLPAGSGITFAMAPSARLPISGELSSPRLTMALRASLPRLPAASQADLTFEHSNCVQLGWAYQGT